MTIEGSARPPRRQTLNVPMKIIAGGTGGTLLAVAVYLVVNGVIIGLLGVVLVGLLLLFVYSRMTMEIAEPPVQPLKAIRKSPLIDAPAEAVSVWDGIPVGTTSGGERLVIPLTDGSFILAGRTRSGKTVMLNNIVAACAMDPRVQLSLFDGKATIEFRRYRHVAKVDRTADPAKLMAFLTELDREVERRYDELGTKHDVVKLTRELYDSGAMKLHVVVIDELANYLVTPRNKKIGSANIDLLSALAAKGAGAGVIFVLTNQRISADLVPAKIRSNVDNRVAFRVWDAVENDMALGPGSAKKGYDASSIPPGVDHRGVGYAAIAGMPTVKFRGDLLEYDDTLVLAEKAAFVRGVVDASLTNDRSAVDPESSFDVDEDSEDEDVLEADYLEPDRDLLEDVKTVWRRDEKRLHMATILERLQALDGDFYGTWSAQLFGRRMRDIGLARFKKQMTIGDRVNWWGLEASALYAGNEDGKDSKLERAERETAALEMLSDHERLLMEAKIAELKSATACAYCHTMFTEDNPVTIDHLIPLAKGGTSHAWSLVACCRSCNSSKKDRDVVEFITSLKSRAS